MEVILVKTLLNITVFASAVLSIFSTSLTLYEVPELKEAISVMEEDKTNQEFVAGDEVRRIYISHDVSKTKSIKPAPIVVTKNPKIKAYSAEESIKVFGVTISKGNSHRRI